MTDAIGPEALEANELFVTTRDEIERGRAAWSR